MNWYNIGLPMMALKGRLTSSTSKSLLSVRYFSDVPNVTGRDMLPREMMEPEPTRENRHEGESLDMGICSFGKAVRLMRFRATPPSIRMWYNMTLAMVGETTSGSYSVPIMFLGAV
jgi:hypothetical protein